MSRNNSKEYSNFLNKFLLTTAHYIFFKIYCRKRKCEAVESTRRKEKIYSVSKLHTYADLKTLLLVIT